MVKKKNQKMSRNREMGRFNCGAKRSGAEDHVTEVIFYLPLRQGQKTR